MRTIQKSFTLVLLMVSLITISSCGGDDSSEPVESNLPEIITNVVLTFTPTDGGNPVITTAETSNQVGFRGDFPASKQIDLMANTTYTLTIDFTNSLDPNNIINIKDEVLAEATEHKLLFIWLGDLFVNPTGNGNADNPLDIINYNDQDSDGLPLGLSTGWTTGSSTTGEPLFRVLLMHQPETNGQALKSVSSGINNGNRDFNIVWRMNIN